MGFMLDATQNDANAQQMMPDTTVSVREVFGLDVDLSIPAFSTRSERVPDIDPSYLFDFRTTMAILSGFANDWRVLISGLSRHR